MAIKPFVDNVASAVKEIYKDLKSIGEEAKQRINNEEFTKALIKQDQLRDGNLVINGSGEFGDQINFGRFSPYRDNDLNGAYMGFRVRNAIDIICEQTFPVFDIENDEYAFCFDVKVLNKGATKGNTNHIPRMYAYVASMTYDERVITPTNVPVFTFRLGAPLNIGENRITVHPEDRAAFQKEWDKYKSRTVPAWFGYLPYKSVDGRLINSCFFNFVAQTQNISRLTYNGTHISPLVLNQVGIRSFNGTSQIPAGTTIAMSLTGGTYYYPQPAVNIITPTQWETKVIRFKLKDALRSGAAKFRLGWLLNRDVGNSAETAIANVRLYKIK